MKGEYLFVKQPLEGRRYRVEGYNLFGGIIFNSDEVGINDILISISDLEQNKIDQIIKLTNFGEHNSFEFEPMDEDSALRNFKVGEEFVRLASFKILE